MLLTQAQVLCLQIRQFLIRVLPELGAMQSIQVSEVAMLSRGPLEPGW